MYIYIGILYWLFPDVYIGELSLADRAAQGMAPALPS